MKDALYSLAFIVVFSLIGGFFSAAETSLVTLRESQISRFAVTRGRRGVKLAELASNPNRFLAAGQVGVTLSGFISAGYGSARIVPVLSPPLQSLGLSQGLASTAAFLAVTVSITYISLVLGELVPKRIALQRTEGVALLAAGPVDMLARAAKPFIWLLSISTNALVRLLGLDPEKGKQAMSNEELRRLVASHAGFTLTERELIDDVFEAGGRELREVMVPRTEVDFISHSTSISDAAQRVIRLPHSRYPVVRGSADEVVGFVHVRDVLDPSVAQTNVQVEMLVREVPRFPWSKRVLPALIAMRDGHDHLAIVVDEFGGTAGIVTLEDLVEQLVGDIRDEYDDAEEASTPRIGFTGDIEVDGLDTLDEFKDETQVELPDGPYETVAGYVMFALGQLPKIGDTVLGPGCRLTVIELDGRRAARIRVEPTADPKSASPSSDTMPE